MENLYVIENFLYTYEALNDKNLVGEEEYAYIEPPMLDLGNGIFLIIDNSGVNFEVLKEFGKGEYRSLTVNDTIILQDFFSEYLKTDTFDSKDSIKEDIHHILTEEDIKLSDEKIEEVFEEFVDSYSWEDYNEYLLDIIHSHLNDA